MDAVPYLKIPSFGDLGISETSMLAPDRWTWPHPSGGSEDFRTLFLRMGARVLTVVIPVWNGRSMLDRAISETLEYLDTLEEEAELLVVSDGCDDRPEEILGPWTERDPRFRWAALDRHRGKGAAIRKGVLEARGDLIAMLDVDLSAKPDSLDDLRAAMTPDVAIVCGSRALSESKLPKPQGPLRSLSGNLFRAWVMAMTGLEIRDTQCGCKLFRASAVKGIFQELKTEGFAFDVELLVLARGRGLKIEEVPIEWSDSDQSSVRLFQDGIRMIWTVMSLKDPWQGRD